MKVSVNWIKLMNANYGTSDSSELKDIDKLVQKIGEQLGAVEEVIDLGKRYQGIYTVKVVECVKHPNADKLHVCLIDDGGVVKDVKRKGNGLVEVVCGAPNVKAGLTVAWIPPGATVPSTFDKDPFVLEARELRGVVSNGMLASPKELAISDSHEGLLIVEEDIKPGTPFVEVYRLDDHIIDIENKMFTHRPDCFGLLGVAREIAGIYNKPFKSPDWYREDAQLSIDGRKNVLKLSVENEIPELVPRFCAVAVTDVKVGPSPVWLQSYLARSGIRPINNIVDVTNWFMLATAQPLHAYDYDKVASGKLDVRLARKGEELKLLNGKTIKLNGSETVITDGSKAIGLGGVMGGADTEVDENTKSIILEVASFDMNQTRKTSMEHGLFTDAATRFTKGQSPRQNMAVLVKAAHDLTQLFGGRIASKVIDDYPQKLASKPVKVSVDFINARLGEKLDATKIKNLLTNVEFDVKMADNNLNITAPFWRTDIEIPEDIVEEVGRLYGYDKLLLNLPTRRIEPAEISQELKFKARLRDILVRAGANEVLTYSFVNKRLLEAAGQDPKNAFHIRNALSPDLQYYRLSLTPSLLDKVNPNIRAGFDQFAIFEIGKGHIKSELDSEGLPKEFNRLSLVVASRPNQGGAAYFAARKFCDFLFKELGIEGVSYAPLKAESSLASPTYYQPGRAAEIKIGGTLLGRLGEYSEAVKSGFKLPNYCAGFDLHIKDLMAKSSPNHYTPLNRFPTTDQDICLRSNADLSYIELTDFITDQLHQAAEEHGYTYNVEPIDIFQREGDKSHKQTTWRITLAHPERTLTTKEVNKLIDHIAASAHDKLKAERV